MLLWGGSIALVVFHAALLGRRLEDLTLLEPGVAIRWLVSALLIGGALALKRREVSPLQGRTSVVFWLLILLLHVQLPGVASPGSVGAEAPPLLPVAVGLVVAGALALAATAHGRARRRPLGIGVLARPAPPSVAAPWRSIPGLFSRPPPVGRSR